MCWLVPTSKDLGGRPPLASRCISLSWLFFHGANAGSNPAGDAKSKTYRRNVYSLFKGRIGNHAFLGLLSTGRAWPRMNTRICYNCIKSRYEHIHETETRCLALAGLQLADGKGER